MNNSQRRLLSMIINDVDDMSISTIRGDGFPQNTTVSYFNKDEAIYFAISSASQKANNIANDKRVSITINRPYRSWNDIQGLSMGAHAHLLADPEEIKSAGDLLLEKFPQAADFEFEKSVGGPADEEVNFYRLEPVALSLLDYTKGFGHTENIEY